MNSKEFFHTLFGSVVIIYDGNGNIYSIGDQLVEKLGYTKSFLREVVPEEFIIVLEEVGDMKKLVPEKYRESDTIILKEPGVHILIASSGNPLARKFSIWLFSEIFPRIRGSAYHSVYY